jgi:hypothetical protein
MMFGCLDDVVIMFNMLNLLMMCELCLCEGLCPLIT